MWTPDSNRPPPSSSDSSSTPNNDPINRYAPIAPYLGNNVHPQQGVNNPKKAHRACDGCRQKKIKCRYMEETNACGNCLHSNKECTFNRSIKKRGPPKGYIGLLEDRLKRIENLIDTIPSKTTKQPNAEASTSTDQQPTGTSHTGHKRSGSDYKLFDELTDIDSPDFILKGLKISGHLTEEGRFISENSLVKLICQGQFSVSKRKKILSQFGLDIQHHGNDDYFHIKKFSKDKDFRKSQIGELVKVGIIKPTETISTIDEWLLRVSGVDKHLSDRLLKVYFAYIHPLLPVINKTEFLEEYRGIRPNFPAGPLLNVIFGATVRYIENCKKFNDVQRLNDNEPWDFPDNFSEKLYKQLLTFLNGPYQPRLTTIQALIIANNHFANVDNWTSGWLLNCIAVRMSQDLGLHRSPDGWKISEQEKETRKMIWWSAYVLDRWFAAGSGRPLTIFDDDCDVGYPSQSVSIDEIMDKPTENDQHLPRFPSMGEQEFSKKVTDKTIPMNEPFIRLIKLSEILGGVLQNLYTPKAKKYSTQYGCDTVVGFLNDALSKWREALPPLLQITNADKRYAQTDTVPILSMSGLICLSYCTLVILLHRPFIENSMDSQARTKESSDNSLNICTSAAIRITEVADSMHYRDFLLVSWGFALYPIFTAALIHIYNCSNPDSIVSDMAKSNLMRSLAVVDKLCLLSPMATNMGEILKKVIAISPIFVDDPDFIEALNIDASKKVHIPFLNKMIEKRYSDKGKETPSITTDNSPQSTDQSANQEGNTVIDTSPALDENWWKQLYSPTQTEFMLKGPNPENQQVTTNYNQAMPQVNQRVVPTQQPQNFYSLGLGTSGTSGSSFSGNNQSNRANISNVLPATSNDLFSNFLLSNIPPAALSNTATTQPLPMNLVDGFMTDADNTSQRTYTNNSQNDLSALFRYTPENPFWSIPSSMEMDDWVAFLLPHEQLQKQQETNFNNNQ